MYHFKDGSAATDAQKGPAPAPAGDAIVEDEVPPEDAPVERRPVEDEAPPEDVFVEDAAPPEDDDPGPCLPDREEPSEPAPAVPWAHGTVCPSAPGLPWDPDDVGAYVPGLGVWVSWVSPDLLGLPAREEAPAPLPGPLVMHGVATSRRLVVVVADRAGTPVCAVAARARPGAAGWLPGRALDVLARDGGPRPPTPDLEGADWGAGWSAPLPFDAAQPGREVAACTTNRP